MQLPELLPGRFIHRDNRFRATVRVDGQTASAHVPNSGRLADLFVAGRPIWLARAGRPGRQTGYDLKLVDLDGVLVSVDARLPNTLFAEAVAARRLPAFPYPTMRAEVLSGDSRLDFRLAGPAGTCWVETKSVTLVESGVALFPDVPTARGRRHLEALIRLCQAGQPAAVVFVIQRADAVAFRPHRQADPDFAALLGQATQAGVAVHAYTCTVSRSEITLATAVDFVEQ